MEQELEIVIVNAQKITRKETGEVLTKVGYMTKLEQSNNFIGYSVLDAWCNADAFVRFKEFMGKDVKAIIGLKSGKNNSLNAFIKKINNIAL